MDEKKRQLFEQATIPKAVSVLVGPSIVSQIITILYNMADIFFVGKLNNPDQVAAVSMAAPAMLLFPVMANLLGLGGSGTASRAMGAGKDERAGDTACFCLYAALLTALVFAAAGLLFRNPILRMLGTAKAPNAYLSDYFFWVFILGAIPSLLSLVLSHLIRADGAARLAGYVLSAGGILNLLLDPLFIFGLHMEVKGAAVATFLSNIFTFSVFSLYLLRRRGSSFLSLVPTRLRNWKSVCPEVIRSGLPSMLQTLLAAVSNAMLNVLSGPYGSEAVAAFGIVKKLDQIPVNITIGISQGIVPLMAYNYSAHRPERMRGALRWALLLSVGFSVLCTLCYELLPAFFVGLFIREPVTVACGSRILRIMCLATPLVGVGFVIITVFQATGFFWQGTLLSAMRRGILEIPIMLLANRLQPLTGLAFGQPITEGITMALSLALLYRYLIAGQKKSDRCGSKQND